MNSARARLVLAVALSPFLVGSGCEESDPGTEAPLAVEEFRDRYGPDPASSGFVELEVDGHTLQTHYQVAGNGPDLLLLHGICDSLHTWDSWVEDLEDDFRLVRVDYPPFGLTDSFPDGDYSEARTFTFLDRFLARAGVEGPCLIAGNSLGAGIAWRYAVSRPGRVRGLVLIDPAGFVDEKSDLPGAIRWADNPVAAAGMRRRMPRSRWEKTIRELYGNAPVPPEILDREVSRFHDLSRLPGQRNDYVEIFRHVLRLAEEEEDERIAGRVGRLDLPVQILWGEADPWFPPLRPPGDGPDQGHLEMWKEALPRPPEIRTYPGVGHMPQLQAPTKTAADARRFLLAIPSP